MHFSRNNGKSVENSQEVEEGAHGQYKKTLE